MSGHSAGYDAPAELLRKAASLMRERATSGTLAAPWGAKVLADGRAWVYGSNDYSLSMHGFREDAEHIASWHPAVALAVADMLDNAAEDVELRGPDGQLPFDYSVGVSIVKAVAVARAYLGTTVIAPVEGNS